jgi:hypothetical protein
LVSARRALNDGQVFDFANKTATGRPQRAMWWSDFAARSTAAFDTDHEAKKCQRNIVAITQRADNSNLIRGRRYERTTFIEVSHGHAYGCQ